jgi:ribosomal-protein-alanine N-acetyltransferase
MHSLLNRSPLSADQIDVRPAFLSDRSAINALTENNQRVHFNLDWWTFDNWLYPDRPSDAIWLAQDGRQLVGLLLAPFDNSPTIWLRSIAIANGYAADPIFTALLARVRTHLPALAINQLTALAHPQWLADLLPRVNFEPLTEVMTLRKSDRALPNRARLATAFIRTARLDDVPAITANDRAAFVPVWWHSSTLIAHILHTVSHFVVAELDGQIVGHAFSDIYGGQGHLIRLVVHPDYQGRGIGEQLLLESLDYQMRLDAYPFTLNTQIDNLPSQSLYRRYGYRTIGRPVHVMRLMPANE